MRDICQGHGCAEIVEEVNVESFELTGKVLCAWCVEEDFERRASDEDDTSPVKIAREGDAS